MLILEREKKMKKNKFLILSLILCIFYVGIMYYNKQNNIKGEKPVITVQGKDLVTSVKAKEKVLLDGVEATDKEDGFLTNDVFVESISPFNENKQRTITYAVFDSDDNLTRTSRNLSYTDYKQPSLTLVKPILVTYLVDKNVFKSFVKATSNVDGDISNQVIVDRVYLDGADYYIDYSVKDSCGGSDHLKLKVDFIDNDQKTNLDIQLSNYLIEVKQGTKIDPMDYVKDVKKRKVSKNDLISKIEVTSNYDADQSGIYDILYEISLPNGDYGITKLSIIVK